MTPKEALQVAFESKISPRLAERGFAFTPSGFAYKRKVGAFTQQISVTLSHRNSEASTQFWSDFNVSSPEYNKWRKKMGLGVDSLRGVLGGSPHWNIPRWRTEGEFTSSYHFATLEQPDAALNDWLNHCLCAGLPYLDELSSWEGAADDLLRGRWRWDRAADFYLIAGKTDKAIAALQAGVEILMARDFSYSENAHPILVFKKKRQEAERDAEVESFRLRIAQLRGGEHAYIKV